MPIKKVIVTGVTGQDGSHMVDYLLKHTCHEIYGSVRRLSVKNHNNILHLENEKRFNLINLDPFQMIGPFQFELEFGASWFMPYPLTYHTYGNLSSWIQISTYLQAW